MSTAPRAMLERMASVLREIQSQTIRVRLDDPMMNYTQVGTIALYEVDRALAEYNEWRAKPKLFPEDEVIALKNRLAELKKP